MGRRKPEPGYSNQSAPATQEPRREHVQEPVFRSVAETLFWRDAVRARQPGEDVVVWAERMKAERGRMEFADQAPPQPSQERMQYGPGADDDV
jgi:hypothetical protein